ncbi:leucine-rich repeat-containing protein 74A-like [Rhinatrema bivittatum]|uniref:leucine-rich repeat-containing protein 74A-like n=1 Tax=Rhinatrema bivittatum TaxID=194408 RepID=UPI00112DF935|nr:leucine-rich repeat-containing protein 74A-like [Rhinatrema bivittatum]
MREATMNLSHHGLGSKGTRAIAIALVSNAFITNLNLDDNRVLAEGVADVVEMLKENCFIQELNLSNNHLEQAGAATISRLLVDNVTLRSLKLSGNMLNHASVKNLAEALAVNGKLEDLDLSHNEFCEKAGEQLGQMLAGNSGLEVLDLSWNYIRLKGAVALSAGLKVNSTLKVLNLAHNGFSNEGSLALREVLKFNSTLTHLDISSNRIGNEGAGMLAKGLEVNQTLQVLQLSQNPINVEGALNLVTSIRKNPGTKLTELNIKNVLVNEKFLVLLKATRKELRGLQVHFGGVTGAIVKKLEQRPDPMKVVQKFLDKRKLRMWDFFRNMDKDGTMIIPVSEFRRALKNQTSIPLDKALIEELVRKLDSKGTGTVDYRDLVDTRKQMVRDERRLVRQEKSRKRKQRHRSERLLRTFKTAVKTVTPHGSALMSQEPGGPRQVSAAPPLSSQPQDKASRGSQQTAPTFSADGASASQLAPELAPEAREGTATTSPDASSTPQPETITTSYSTIAGVRKQGTKSHPAKGHLRKQQRRTRLQK